VQRRTDWAVSSTPAWIERCFPLIAPLTDQFEELAAGVDAQHWSAASSCAGWSIAELVAHVAFGADYYARAIGDAVHGSPRELWSGGGDEAHAQQRTLMRLTPGAGVVELRERCVRLDVALAEVGPSALTRDAWHMRGPRPIWMYVAMRVYELALHRWDLQKSIGMQPSLAREAAVPLVDLLLSAILPQTLDRTATGAGSADVALDFGSTRRVLRISADGIRLIADMDARTTIALLPEDFVLGMSGRELWPGRAHVTGDEELGRNFAAFFRVW
jgi:uncharacterized protein (TIGR03083 family)